MSVFDPVLHAGEARRFKKIVALAQTVNGFEDDVVDLSDAELAQRTVDFRHRLDNGEELDEILPEAFATVREAAQRTIGQRQFDVQVVGGVVLHRGAIAEMRTGEGKTLVATMPAYLNALEGKGVHVATVNPYLAKRDAEWMGQIYRFLGMKVGLIQPDMPMTVRRVNYAADITYGTNNEFGFDYLRDNMAMRKEDLSQRGHHFGIVDEVDSILIDEARTPLIIAGSADEAARWYRTFARHVMRLKRDEHYEVDEAKRTVAANEEGIARIEELLSIENLYDQVHTPLVHYLDTALKAKELYKKDRDYIVQNREVLIVDEFTGRTLPGRRWSDGLHQAVEAKEGVPIQQENQTLATITIQNYFRLYKKLAGMTGTAKTQATEFANVYELEVYEIPTNRPVQRDDRPDSIYKTEDAKWTAVTEDLVTRHNEGQPVLVGTISIEKSERLSGYLSRRGVPHQILNAKQHEREAFIVAQAGRLGAVTLATNMAGRGVDILLGGNAEYLARQEMTVQGWDNDAYLLQRMEPEDREAYEAEYGPLLAQMKEECAAEHDEVVDLGGLYILGTERHESRRIDNQLRGRAGRQGDPGETKFYLSLDDDLMRFFATGMISTVMERLSLPDDMPIESKMVSKAIERAQSQVESQNYEIRKNVLKYDEVMNKQREVVYEQRGQLLTGADLGDRAPEFVAEAVENVVSTYANAEAVPEDWDWEKLSLAMSQLYPSEISDSFDHETTSYPEVLDAYQQDAITYYKAREAEVMAGWLPKLPLDQLPERPLGWPGPATEAPTDVDAESGDEAELEGCYEVLDVEPTAELADIRTAFRRRVMDVHPALHPSEDGRAFYDALTAWTVLGDEERREAYDAANPVEGVSTKVGLPALDQELLASTYETFRRGERMRELERVVFISLLDNKWREHLYEMDYLREGIGLRGYGQRDPEIEYKREGYDMFQAMLASTKDEFVRYMFHVQIVAEAPEPEPQPLEALAVPAALAALPGGGADGNSPPPSDAAAGDASGVTVTALGAAASAPEFAQPPPAAVAAVDAPAAAGAPAPAGAPARQAPASAPKQQPKVAAGAGARTGGPSSSSPLVAGSRAMTATAGAPGANGHSEWEKTPRNAPCPCGSGKKYKKCHGSEV